MGDKSNISWTDATWNPVVGCSHVSPGCEHCYAEALSLRRGWTPKTWTANHAIDNVQLKPERLQYPIHWRTPRRIFVNSMSDLFHELVPFWFIDDVFEVMRRARQHIFQVLTKRPERMLEWADSTNARHDDLLGGWDSANPLPNVWLGVSVEDQRRANERIPLLVKIPAAVHFLSCEPLLAPICLREAMPCGYYCDEAVGHVDHSLREIDWVIVGGESGPDFRPMALDWVRFLRDECQAEEVPFFFKQSAARYPGSGTVLDHQEWHEYPAVLAPPPLARASTEG